MEIGFLFLLILIVLFLLYVRREGLEASGTIQPITDVITPTSTIKYWNLLDASTQSDIKRFVEDPNNPAKERLMGANTQEKAQMFVASILQEFYNGQYTPATTPIGETQIDQFIQKAITDINMYGLPPQQSTVFLSIYQNGTMKKILSSYFLRSPGATATPAATATPLPGTTGTATQVARPISTDPKLRMTVASYSGVPGNNTGEIEKYIGYVQKFYDNYYLPAKNPPTQLMIQDFVRSIPGSDFPIEKRASLEAIIDNWFTQFQTPPTLLAGNPQSQQQRTPGTSTTTIQTTTQVPTTTQPVSTFTPPEPQKEGTKIFGPVWAGVGKPSGDGDGKGTKPVYPSLIGGYPEGADVKEFDLPSANSLGLNNGSQFLPYSRSPGDQDGSFFKFRVGNAFQPSKTDPVPALTDFSAFQ